ncbi:hypothetical protein Tco_1007646, partial [Tanacetum coccineum]
ASIRSDLLFDNVDGIDSLNNQAIFDTIQLIGPSPSIAILDSNPEGSGGNHGGQSSNDISLSGNEDSLTLQKAKERSETTSHTSQILDEECCTKDKIDKKDFSEGKGVHKGYVSKQGRKSIKSFKGEPSVHKDPTFDDLNDIMDDAMDYMESEDAQDEGRTSSVVLEEKESADKEVSTEAPVSIVKPNEGTSKRNEGTNKQDEGTDSTKVSTDKQDEGTADQNEGKIVTQTAPTTTSTPTPTIFGDDETIAQLANDEEVARTVQEEWEAEEEKKRLDEEEATKVAFSNEYDFIQARLNADKILTEKLQEEEREMYTIEQRTKFLYDTIHARGKKHSDMKTKSFDEIQVLYKKIKRSNDSFIAIGLAEDEKMIKEMNEQAANASKKRKMKSKKRKFTSKDDEELRLCLTIASDEDKEVDYKILDKKYPIIKWRYEYLTTKPQYDETEEVEDVYLNVVIRSSRQRRYFSTLMAVLSILNRDDICTIYQLVMNRYQNETPEGFDKILGGDLIIMFNQSDIAEFWNASPKLEDSELEAT